LNYEKQNSLFRAGNSNENHLSTGDCHFNTAGKLAAHRKSLHGKDMNEIMAMGTRIKTEKISYKSWQKNFGKSVQMRAPSMLISNLKRKAENVGGYLIEFPTHSTKLSQMCHICGNTVKKPLSQRWHICCGIEMQRDLYSAFLSKCVDVKSTSLDIARARLLWPGLEPVLSAAVSRVIQSANGGKILPASFGLGRRLSGSSVKPEVTITEAVDAVINEDESHREVI
jgi:hypothetical protein